ncbi:hypothetical protein NDU88_005108 [Pleurodeles waltl]|uniref:Uncharacterized protein n=1 Tax=Pleurodeles waltl TaxID=8319 RepID=A0AAV7W6X2_PLEWA|nr:hypothetical protein NDU88_005108 [Pleurodeles waltl]
MEFSPTQQALRRFPSGSRAASSQDGSNVAEKVSSREQDMREADDRRDGRRVYLQKENVIVSVGTNCN